MNKTGLEVFFSYAHADETWRDQLEKHLAGLKRQKRIAAWHDRNIPAGAEWAPEIDTHLKTAHLILLLISPDFISSEYCWGVELRKAIRRHNAGEACVIPIIVRPVDWKHPPLPNCKPYRLMGDRSPPGPISMKRCSMSPKASATLSKYNRKKSQHLHQNPLLLH